MRRQRVSASVRFPIRFRLLDRDELSRSKCETARALNGELQVFGLVRQEYRPRQAGRQQLPLDWPRTGRAGRERWRFRFQYCARIAHTVLDARAEPSARAQLLDSDRLRQVSGLVNIAPATNRDVIGQKLERNDFENRRKQFGRVRHINHMVG